MAERLGGETFLYIQVAGDQIVVVQAGGESPPACMTISIA